MNDPLIPDSTGLLGLFAEQAGRRPDATAVEYGAERLSFAGLDARSGRLAAALRERGVGREDPVGLFTDPCLDLVVGVWGVLRAGAAYLPLSSDHPDARLSGLAADGGLRAILGAPAQAVRAAAVAPGVPFLPFTAAPTRPQPPGPPPRPDNLAYVIYTSGSTGAPKGVMIEHRAIAAQLRWLARVQGIGPGDAVLQRTPLGFDAAQWEVLSAALGARVVMRGPGDHRDPGRIVDLVDRHGVTVLQCVPTLLRVLADELAERGRGLPLRRLYSGGESLSRELADRLLHALPGCELVNLYGPTECTINASAHSVPRDPAASGPDRVPIGTPVDGVGYHLLDADLRPVGAGRTGELYLSGPQLARGYLGRPDLTADRFRALPAAGRAYRTGDLAHLDADGVLCFDGRRDNQVKLRGFRIELDEVRLAIERHAWVGGAAAVVRDDGPGGAPTLVAFLELDPEQAALMDQGLPGDHHVSKQGRVQARAQMSGHGRRPDAALRLRTAVDLPGAVPTARQQRHVFARKTYRLFDGGPVTRAALLALLARVDGKPQATRPRPPDALTFEELGGLLRYFGAFASPDRLLPKYGYASPGALYATQLLLEVNEVAGLKPGAYYYHPVEHRLVLVHERTTLPGTFLRVHLVGRVPAIEEIYRVNAREVLELEAGHLVGLLEQVLAEQGLSVVPHSHRPDRLPELAAEPGDHYLGCFEVVPYRGPCPLPPVDVYAQAHPGRIADLPAGQYRLTGGDLERIGDELLERRHVVAINQRVHDRASFGVSLVATGSPERNGWLGYLGLGLRLHRLQAGGHGMGLMSAGYSSASGHDLPSARRLTALLAARGLPTGPSYFALGGAVSDEQVADRGMREDAVHTKGPAELIRDDLTALLPAPMVPHRIIILERLPLTVGGKVDLGALRARPLEPVAQDGLAVPPRTPTERRVAAIWAELMGGAIPSVTADFFAAGGDSVTAVGLVNRVNRETGGALPLQVIFDAPTVELLSGRVDEHVRAAASRLVRLRSRGLASPVYCWPGLGGYPMNLRTLADRAAAGRPFVGVQAYGINPGETPYPTVAEMAAADVRELRRVHPGGPYTLWGYSFGARVAFEAAHQLEQAGERVAELVLLAPGSPRIAVTDGSSPRAEPGYRNQTYLAVLLSVFTGAAGGPLLEECLREVTSEGSFASFVAARVGLDEALVRRITEVVRRTYHFRYTDHELARRRPAAPLTVLCATGDEPSFVAACLAARPDGAVTIQTLPCDHYAMLRAPAVDLVAAVLPASDPSDRR